MSDIGMTDIRAPDARSDSERLVADLVADLRPVRRVWPPWAAASAWLALVAAAALVLAWFADMPAVEGRIMAAPDMWLAVLGSTLTAIFAAVAAFQLGLPDRTPLWAVLPLPVLALWIGASGMGCARTWLIPSTHDASMAESASCLRFILMLSLPLSFAIFLLLRRGFSLYPALTGLTAGLAVASAAATLLNFFHPFDASVTDLAVHLGAVLVVVLVHRVLAGRILAYRARRVAQTTA